MLRPRVVRAPFLTVALFTFASLMIPGASLHARAQQSSTVESIERERGIQLYERGDIDGAIKALRAAVKQKKDDPDAWHYLGLAYSRHDKLKDARKAFEEAIKLRPGFALAHANLASTLLNLNKLVDARGAAQNALAIDSGSATAHYVLGAAYLREGDPAKALKEAEFALKARADFPAALLLKAQALLALYPLERMLEDQSPPLSEEDRAARRLARKEAAEILEKYLELEPNAAGAESWREVLETIRFYARLKDKSKDENKDEDKVYTAKDRVTTKVRITYKPEPPYTEAALQARVTGTIVLQAVFAADGKVKRILVLRSLPMGLTEKAIEAARKIKFVPATKDGRPVSMFYRIEYNFLSR